MEAQFILADLAAQADWYAKLLKLAEIQHTLIEQERTDDLLVVLDRRQKIVEQIALIEQRLKSIKQDWRASAAGLTVEDRARVEAKFAEVRGLLGQITQADQDDAMLLTQRKITVGQQLRQTNTGQQINRRYAAGAYAGVGSRMDVSK
jgi:chorismate mutase